MFGIHNAVLIAAIGAVGVPLIGFIWTMFLKRESTMKVGRALGSLVSVFLGQRLGRPVADAVDGRLATTAQDFIDGFKEGLTDPVVSAPTEPPAPPTNS
jgi:hypothetical protein